LKLAPGDQNDALAGEIIQHDLEAAKPEYLAISYVCGDDDRSRHHINVSGSNIGIYKNADEVLRRFRGQHDAVFLWIDVICIDQVCYCLRVFALIAWLDVTRAIRWKSPER
jgi:hypothetical protein